jgi:phenylpropionate dioxygenase-like ring-hydroxylating dioxygenase large terminal subunit
MLPNHWYAILESREVKRGRLTGVTRLGEKLVLWRAADGAIGCLQDQCPHRGAALSAGKIIHDHVECPFHGFQFDPGGRCQLIPANGRHAQIPKAFQARAYPAREAHGLIWVWWGEARQDLPEIPWFESIDSTFSYWTFRDHWAVDYTRAIENQLDVVHLPFVHATTIGRGGRTLVNGPLVRWQNGSQGAADRMDLWVYNDVDRGQEPLKPSEIPDPQRRPFLQLYLPNVWQNWISDSIRVFVAFAPIDRENTMIYLRFYQNSVRLPILRRLVPLIATPFNVIILRQDKRVVLTQRPKRTELRMGEKLIQGDAPIVAFRRRREELLQTASAD